MFDRYSETPGADFPSPNKFCHFKYYKTLFTKKANREKTDNDASKLKSIGLIIFFFLSTLSFFGCSKNQDVKIVHNYLDRMPSFSDKKQQVYIDMLVYKRFKDLNGKESITIYKAD